MTAAPASRAAFSEAKVPLAGSRLMKRSLKLTPPMALPMGGMRMSLTMEVTILPKAAPMTTPTARSTTLPRMANSLNSLSMLIAFWKECLNELFFVQKSADRFDSFVGRLFGHEGFNLGFELINQLLLFRGQVGWGLS